MTLAGLPNSFNQLAKAGNETVVSNAEQRTTGYVANAGCLNYQYTGTSFGEAAIPIKVFLRDESIVSGSPGNHRRHPGPAFRLGSTNRDWLKQKRVCNFGLSRP